jgi:cytochrome c-type biogenesis protein CcmH
MILLLVAILAAEPINPESIVGAPAGPALSGQLLEEATRETASLLRCPVCQGLSVEASPSESAVAMRNEVKALRAAGFSHEQTIEYFEASYGDFIRLEPKREGFALAVWVLPVIFVAIGGFLVMGSIRAEKIKVEKISGKDLDPALQGKLEQVRRETGELP